MGGIGSGNWHRQRSCATVNMLPELNATDFKKPSGKVVAIPRDELERREVTYRYLRDGRNILLFRSDSRDDDSDTLPPVLKMETTPCHFGGSRTWLLCPTKVCGRRAQSLFVSEHGRIACRKCLGLLYESQYGGRLEKQMTRLRAMHRKLLRGGANHPAAAMQERFESVIAELGKIDRVDS